MKGKGVGKKNENVTGNRCIIEEETEELGEKPFCRPPSDNQSTR